MLPFHHDRDVPLRGALSYCAHVDVRGAEGVEHLARDTGRTGHPITDYREDGQVRIDVDVLDLPFLQLALERVTDDGGGALRLFLRDGAADGVLRASL